MKQEVVAPSLAADDASPHVGKPDKLTPSAYREGGLELGADFLWLIFIPNMVQSALGLAFLSPLLGNLAMKTNRAACQRSWSESGHIHG